MSNEALQGCTVPAVDASQVVKREEEQDSDQQEDSIAAKAEHGGTTGETWRDGEEGDYRGRRDHIDAMAAARTVEATESDERRGSAIEGGREGASERERERERWLNGHLWCELTTVAFLAAASANQNALLDAYVIHISRRQTVLK